MHGRTRSKALAVMVDLPRPPRSPPSPRPKVGTSKNAHPSGERRHRLSAPIWAIFLVLLVSQCAVFAVLLVVLSATAQPTPGVGGRGGGGAAFFPAVGLLDLGASSSSSSGSLGLVHLLDETNVPIPRRADGTPMSVEERLRYLELKSGAYMNFGTHDPFFASRHFETGCMRPSRLDEFGCKKGWEGYRTDVGMCRRHYDHVYCLDGLPSPAVQLGSDPPKPLPVSAGGRPCLAYEFGVREQPYFGAVMARTFGCEVHVFDPSPVAMRYMESAEARKLIRLPNYHYHPYGAGGVDGNISLNDYVWGQVSVLRYPSEIVDCGPSDLHKKNLDDGEAPCAVHRIDEQGRHSLPVRTLSTIIRDLGHTGRTIDVMKIDIEGSEYSFLEQAFDTYGGCPSFVEQIALEWHHLPFDPRYGAGSSPPINALVTLMHACGLYNFWQHSEGGYPNPARIYSRVGMGDVRFNLATFRREHSNSATSVRR